MNKVVAVVADLIFSSKITGTGRALGVDVRATPSVEALAAMLDEGGVRLVIVDMSLPAEMAAKALSLASGHSSHPATLAYCSHVSIAEREAALANGAQEVLPRSRFSAELPEILRGPHEE